MRLAFMGSPAFAVPALRALHAAGHTIAAVYAQPPRRSGRGQALTPCPVHAVGLELGLDVRTPERLRRDDAAQADFAALDLDAAIVVAYGQILPQSMLDAPRRGCLNIHASLLPRWRGAAPIQAAVLAGDTQTGITIMQMDAGLDTGAMLSQAAVPIGPHTTAAELHDTLAALGGPMVLDVLDRDPMAVTQPDGATYAAKLSREDGRMEWSLSATALDRQVRALTPWPGTFTTLGDETIKVLRVTPEPATGAPGTVLDDRLLVACGDGALRLVRVQRPGRPAMDADALLRGAPIPPGSRFR